MGCVEARLARMGYGGDGALQAGGGAGHMVARLAGRLKPEE